MKLRVYRGDWFFNMGIVGFLNIIKKADKQAEIFIMEDYIEFDSLFLENFHEYYFNYFMDEYDVSKRIKKNIDYSINFIKSKPDRIKDGIKKIKDSVKQQNDKIKKFDEEKFNLIKEKLDSMSKIKSYDEFASLEALVDETIDIFKIKSINDRLTANLYKYVVQDNYFGQVSFFNVAKAKLDLDGLKQVMFNDYLRQIIYFGELEDLLEENDYDKLKNYLNDRLNSIAKDINEKKVSKSRINTIEKIMKEINKNFIKKNKSIEDIKKYNGRSSRLSQRLVQQKQLFSSIDAYISGSIDAGLFHISGKPSAGVTLEQAEAAVREELDLLQQELVDEQELEKVKNKFESTQIFGNINYLNVATNLAWYELLGRAEDMEKEVDRYRSVTAEQLRAVAQSAFRKENGVILYYKKQQN